MFSSGFLVRYCECKILVAVIWKVGALFMNLRKIVLFLFWINILSVSCPCLSYFCLYIYIVFFCAAFFCFCPWFVNLLHNMLDQPSVSRVVWLAHCHHAKKLMMEYFRVTSLSLWSNLIQQHVIHLIIVGVGRFRHSWCDTAFWSCRWLTYLMPSL